MLPWHCSVYYKPFRRMARWTPIISWTMCKWQASDPHSCHRFYKRTFIMNTDPFGTELVNSLYPPKPSKKNHLKGNKRIPYPPIQGKLAINLWCWRTLSTQLFIKNTMQGPHRECLTTLPKLPIILPKLERGLVESLHHFSTSHLMNIPRMWKIQMNTTRIPM